MMSFSYAKIGRSEFFNALLIRRMVNSIEAAYSPIEADVDSSSLDVIVQLPTFLLLQHSVRIILCTVLTHGLFEAQSPF